MTSSPHNQEMGNQKPLKIGNRLIGNGAPCYIIAEIGVNFNGDLNLAEKMIEAAAACGVDAVKFQTFRAEEFVADQTLYYTYVQADGTTVTESQYDMFKRLELPVEWHDILKRKAQSLDVDFLSSSADRAAVDVLSSVGVPALKLASEDLINIDLLEYVAKKRLPVFLSTGMADYYEITTALNIFKIANHNDIVLLHCVSKYPVEPQECNLLRIKALQRHFPFPVGYSDHSEGTEAAMLAIALGACLVEKHFTLDKSLPGPDHKMSSDPEEMKELVKRIRLAEKMLGIESLGFNETEDASRAEFRRSIVAKSFLPKGSRLGLEMLAYKRPGGGLKPYQRELILGGILNRDIAKDEMIQIGDVMRSSKDEV